MILDISAASDIGILRDHNEDMVLVGRTLVRNETMNTKVAISNNDTYAIAIADGIGGSNAGEEASKEALTHFRESLYSSSGFESKNALELFIDEWAKSVQSHFRNIEEEKPECKGFGTTLTAFVIASGIIMAINCGDSRIYRVRNGILTQLTTDHSLERFTHNPADSHVITNAISSDGETFFDKIKLNGKILHDDIYLLCSDGLSDMLRDDQIEALVSQGRTAAELVDAACKMGGKDNISVCVVRISEN